MEIPRCYYAKGRVTRLQESQVMVEGAPHTIFELRTTEVLVDESTEAPLRAGLTFDVAKLQGDHVRMFEDLRSLATGRASS